MFLGIDTSAYTTSLAIVQSNDYNEVKLDLRKVLDVKLGKRGLRQSEAVFQHVKNLNELANDYRAYPLKAVAVSVKPKPHLNSYMPVFKVGQTVANLLAKSLNIPLYEFSHQEGHIAAGLWSTKSLNNKSKILVIHISGGTSDILEVSGAVNNMKITDLGCSTDLHAGQFVDRVGVMLGAEFPAGKTMDLWSKQSSNFDERLPSHVNKYNMSFSGPESAAKRLFDNGVSKESLSKMVFMSISRTLEKVIRYAYSKTKYNKVLIVGGVAANSFIRNDLVKRMPYNICFCNTSYSSDNAVGTALLALKKYEKQEEV